MSLNFLLLLLTEVCRELSMLSYNEKKLALFMVKLWMTYMFGDFLTSLNSGNILKITKYKSMWLSMLSFCLLCIKRLYTGKEADFYCHLHLSQEKKFNCFSQLGPSLAYLTAQFNWVLFKLCSMSTISKAGTGLVLINSGLSGLVLFHRCWNHS